MTRRATLLALGGVLVAALTCGWPAGAADEAATERPRKSLLPLAQPLWSDLGPRQSEILAPLEAQWNALPSTSKRAWVKLADRVPKMRGADREKALERIREWAALSHEQRRQARNTYRLSKNLDRDGLSADWEQYSQMTPEQRAVLRASGSTSNTAARHAGARTGLAKEAARPLPRANGSQHAAATRPQPARRN